MPVNLRNRDFLKGTDFTTAGDAVPARPCRATSSVPSTPATSVSACSVRTSPLIFEKTSPHPVRSRSVPTTRAPVTYLDPSGSQMGHKESIADTAACYPASTTASSTAEGHTNVEELAEYSDVPVWNGLTDEWHPRRCSPTS